MQLDALAYHVACAELVIKSARFEIQADDH